MPQTPGDAIADAQVFFEKGFVRLEAYLQRWADFQVWLDQQEEVTDENQPE